jgi:hypothetical protein
MTDASYRRAFRWLAVAIILVLYAISVFRIHPTNFFGLMQDDTIYFSSAKALAAGNGYILPSIPGTPAATKYPILYPWILSWVWRWNPSFPSNLADAVGVTVAFGCAFFALVFAFLRSLKGIGDAEALLLTAFCALHPLVIFYGGSLLSDIPFAALALAAMLVGDRAMRHAANSAWPAACAILVGLSIFMRVFGLPVAAGIVLAGLTRRTWRQLLVFSACLAPFFAALLWRAIFPHFPVPPVTGAAALSVGWARTWAYYTSYVAAWKMGIPDATAFWTMLRTNSGFILRGPSDIFLAPLLMPDNIFGRTLIVVVTVAVLAGIVRQARAGEWKPIHFVLPFYVAVILFLNFQDANNRYFLPFWPLFAAGLWLEVRHVLAMVRRTLRSPRGALEKAVAASLAVAILALSVGIVWNYVAGTRTVMAEKSAERAAFLEDKRAAYDWIVRNTAPGTRVVAYEDASLYLYTGRQAMSPVPALLTEVYAPDRMDESLAHITDLPRAIGAELWLFSADDFVNSNAEISAKAVARMSDLEHALPLVYQSDDGRVEIHSLACIQHPEAPACLGVDNVLFPASK